jgi:hypothetical protein
VTGYSKTRNAQAGTIGYPVKATDTEITAVIKLDNRFDETNPNNNKAVRKIQVRPKIETSVRIVNVFVFRDGSWKPLASLPPSERVLYVGEAIMPQVSFVNNSSSHTKFDTEVWVGDGMGVGSAEKLIWQNGDIISPARPSTNRPTKTKLYDFGRTPYSITPRLGSTQYHQLVQQRINLI